MLRDKQIECIIEYGYIFAKEKNKYKELFMDKEFGKCNEEQWEAMLAAMREGKFDGMRILEEIQPLISEFFVCESKKTAEGLLLTFLNGQKFLLTAKAV